MKFGRKRFSGNLVYVCRVESAARHDHDAIRRCPHELVQHCYSLRGSCGATCGKDARCTSADNIFQGGQQICGLVKRAVEGYLEWTCPLNQFRGARYVNGVIGTKNAKDHAIYA